MAKEKEEPKQPEMTIDQATNEVYGYLRKMQITADEHDGLKQRMAFLMEKAKEAEAFKERCETQEVTIKSLEKKKK